MLNRADSNRVGDLACGIDVQCIRFRDHTAEQSDIDRVVRIHEAARLQFLECCRGIVLVSDRNQCVRNMLDLLGRQEHEESRFLQLLVTLIPTRLSKLEANGLQAHLGKLDRFDLQVGTLLGDRSRDQLDDLLRTYTVISVGDLSLKVLACRTLNSLRRNAHALDSTEDRALGRAGVIPVRIRGREGLQDVDINEDGHCLTFH